MSQPKLKDLTIEEQICRVFGKECRLALAVSQAENGTRQCDRLNVNNNKSVDVGVFQLNSVHFKKGYTLSDFTDCEKNVLIAKAIRDASGWEAWVTYNTGAYKRFYK